MVVGDPEALGVVLLRFVHCPSWLEEGIRRKIPSSRMLIKRLKVNNLLLPLLHKRVVQILQKQKPASRRKRPQILVVKPPVQVILLQESVDGLLRPALISFSALPSFGIPKSGSGVDEHAVWIGWTWVAAEELVEEGELLGQFGHDWKVLR